MNENLRKHYNHPFYRKVDEITNEVRKMQIRKGAEKYPEPFTPSSWTGKELAIHALQELRDGQVYVVGMLERIVELEKRGMELAYELSKRKTALSIKQTKLESFKKTLEFASEELYHAYITGDIGNKDRSIKEVMENIDKALEVYRS